MGKKRKGQSARISSTLVQNERGAVLLMALVASVVIVLTALYSNRNYIMENRVEKALNGPAALSILRQKLKATVLNPDAWNNTVSNSYNSTLQSCRQNYPAIGLAACPSTGAQPLTLVDESSDVYVPASGGFFDKLGNSCVDGLLSPCPVKVISTWQAKCPGLGYSCPVIEIRVQFVKANFISSGVKTDSYNFQVELL